MAKLFFRARRSLTIATLIAFGAGASGCVAMDPTGRSLPEDPNPIGFTLLQREHPIFFANAAQNLSPDERQRLFAFLRSVDARPGDHVDIATDDSNLGRARRQSLTDTLIEAGLSDIGAIAATPGTTYIELSQRVAVPPHCQPWPALGAGDTLNAPMPFLGCAAAGNLYQMVVDKRDLAVGRTPGPGPADGSIRAVDTYRGDDMKASGPTTTDSGAIASPNVTAGSAGITPTGNTPTSLPAD